MAVCVRNLTKFDPEPDPDFDPDVYPDPGSDPRAQVLAELLGEGRPALVGSGARTRVRQRPPTRRRARRLGERAAGPPPHCWQQ